MVSSRSLAWLHGTEPHQAVQPTSQVVCCVVELALFHALLQGHQVQGVPLANAVAHLRQQVFMRLTIVVVILILIVIIFIIT